MLKKDLEYCWGFMRKRLYSLCSSDISVTCSWLKLSNRSNTEHRGSGTWSFGKGASYFKYIEKQTETVVVFQIISSICAKRGYYSKMQYTHYVAHQRAICLSKSKFNMQGVSQTLQNRGHPFRKKRENDISFRMGLENESILKVARSRASFSKDSLPHSLIAGIFR